MARGKRAARAEQKTEWFFRSVGDFLKREARVAQLGDFVLRLGDFDEQRARVGIHRRGARRAVRVERRQDVIRRGDARERRREMRRVRV